MAIVQKVLQIGMRASSNVTARVLDANGNYSSGGIPQGVAVIQDVPDGNPFSVTIAGTGAYILGIADTPPAAGTGEPVDVVVVGIMRCQAAAATAIGDILYVANASGQLGTKPADGATSQYIVGTGLEAAAQAGDLISVLLGIGSQHVTA